MTVVDEYLAELREQQDAQDMNPYLNVLLIGPAGCGKTTLAATAPKPVILHSFDPRGTTGIRNVPDVLIDTRFESERQDQPSAYRKWEEEFKRMHLMGVFEEIGTYVIDSFTFWCEAALNEAAGRVRVSSGKKGHGLAHYKIMKNMISYAFRNMALLPCHTVLTGHMQLVREELTSRTQAELYGQGQQVKIEVPVIASETWFIDVNPVSQERSLIVDFQGWFTAKTKVLSGKGPVIDIMDITKLIELAREEGNLPTPKLRETE